VNAEGGSDAHSGLGDFGGRDGLNRAGGLPDVRSGYPVCLHDYRHNYYQCSYTSLPQCNASASGRAAQCVINPYSRARKSRGLSDGIAGSTKVTWKRSPAAIVRLVLGSL